MVLCKGMQGHGLPPLTGPWTPTNGVIPGENGLVAEVKHEVEVTLTVNPHQPGGTSWKPNGIRHTSGLLAACSPTGNP